MVDLIHLQHDGIDLFALLEHLGRVVDLACPRDIGHVNHTVEALFQLHERAVAGEVADLALHLRALGVLLLGGIPRIGFELPHAE